MTEKCENCGVSHQPDDMFCENCGYDFITGSLPVDAEASDGPSVPPPSLLDDGGTGDGEAEGANGEVNGVATGAGNGSMDGAPAPSGDPLTEVPRLAITVSVDRTFFDAVVNDGELDFPDPTPKEQRIEVSGSEIHIGRTSDSRAIHPDIDVADLTEDKAASSRHAVIRVGLDGSYTVTDVGSTNGTFVAEPDSDAIEQGVAMVVEPGVPFFVGAWTRMVIEAAA